MSTEDNLNPRTPAWKRVSYALLVAVFSTHNCTVAGEAPSPVALLRGVESVRTSEDSLKIRFLLEQIVPTPVRKLEFVVEMHGEERLVNQLSANDDSGKVTLVDGSEVCSFHREEHADVCLYNIDYAVGVRGDVAFDPRILGLSDMMAALTTVRKCLWYDSASSVELMGEKEIHGIDVWQVRVTKPSGTVANFWIEEPSFRVHRKTIDSAKMKRRVEINSEYDAESNSPFPTRVHTKRLVNNEITLEKKIAVKSFELGVDIPPERFTLKGMDIAVNTPVVDYRIHRRIGFWDGEGLSENPIRQRKARDHPVSEGNGSLRIVLFAIGLVLPLVVCLLMIRRHSRSTSK